MTHIPQPDPTSPYLSLGDITAARERLRRHVRPSPLIRYPRLDALVHATVWVKHENHQPIGSFKARGALNAALAQATRPTGVVGASAGNHGQGIGLAGQLLEVPACVVIPIGANPAKVASMRALDVEVVEGGRTATECNELAKSIAGDRGWHIIDDFCDPLVMAGAGTVALEILEERPGIDALVVPVGGGALASGCGVAAKGIKPSILTVGVVPAACPSAYLSWRAGRPVSGPCETMADGLAVDRLDASVVQILSDVLDDMVLVTEAEIGAAVSLGVSTLHNLLEPAGAAALAAICQGKKAAGGREIAIVATGANIDPGLLSQLAAP
jgi:threonine dehydratase